MAFPEPHKSKRERADEKKPGGERGAPHGLERRESPIDRQHVDPAKPGDRGMVGGKSHDPKDENLPQKATVGGAKGNPPVGQVAPVDQEPQVGGEGG